MQDLVEQALATDNETGLREDDNRDDVSFAPAATVVVGVGNGGISRLRLYDSYTTSASSQNTETVHSLAVPVGPEPVESEWADAVVPLDRGAEPTARRSARTAGQQRAHYVRSQFQRVFEERDYCLLTVDTADSMAMGAAGEVARVASDAGLLTIAVPVIPEGESADDGVVAPLTESAGTVLPVDVARVRDHVTARSERQSKRPDERVVELLADLTRTADAVCLPLDVRAWRTQFESGGLAVPWSGRLSTTEPDWSATIADAIDPVFAGEQVTTTTWSGALRFGDEVTLEEIESLEARLESWFQPRSAIGTPESHAPTRSHTLTGRCESTMSPTTIRLSLVQFVGPPGSEAFDVIR